MYSIRSVLEAWDINWPELRQLCRSVAKEKALRLRGAIELDEQEYAGKTSSRKAIFGDDALPASSNGFRCAKAHVCSSTEHEFSHGTGSTLP